MRFIILRTVHTVLYCTVRTKKPLRNLLLVLIFMSGIDQRNAAINGDDVLLKQYIEARCNVCSSGKTLSNFMWTIMMVMIIFVDYLQLINL
jgi:hypothetical protein